MRMYLYLIQIPNLKKRGSWNYEGISWIFINLIHFDISKGKVENNKDIFEFDTTSIWLTELLISF